MKKFIKNLFKSKRQKFDELLKYLPIIEIRAKDCDEYIEIITPLDNVVGVKITQDDLGYVERVFNDLVETMQNDPSRFDIDENLDDESLTAAIEAYPRVEILREIYALMEKYHKN